MDKEITADWARTTAKEIHGEKVKTELIKCGSEIRTAVKQNKFVVNVSMYADKMTVTELESRGFEVHQQDNQRDGSFLIIKW